jgi:hypothetical protein
MVGLLASGCVADAGFATEGRGAGVVGGQAEQGYPSVGYLIVNGSRSCGVTVIGARAAVTASHCVVGGGNFGMGFGEGGNERSARTVVMHPQYQPDGMERYRHDVAVLLFDQDLGAAAATITAADQGSSARYIGYGRTTPGDYDVMEGYTGERKSASQSIERVDPLSIWTSGIDGGLCWGDSGGPLMNEGTNEILGVLADFNGVFDCQVGNRMIFTSLAGERDFIDRAITGELGGMGQGGGDDPQDGNWGGGGGGGQCEFRCQEYGYAVNQCNEGWFCDGACIEYTGCNMGGGGGGGGQCEYRCQDYGYGPGQCYEGWYCDGQCLTYAGCGFGQDEQQCTYACDDYNYWAGLCYEGWFCDGACLVPAAC